ncbi:MAG: transposase [Acidobacteriia bacterium]|nr:transposase [Terriglobia bacterium]
MRVHRRRLPHVDASGAPVFVTWCLDGSLPAGRVFQREHLTSGEAFATWDRLLEENRAGARFLAQPEIADLVVAKLREFEDSGLCGVDSFVVMPNHVHVLWTPTGSLAELMRRVKGSTAVAANRILGRAGQKSCRRSISIDW